VHGQEVWASFESSGGQKHPKSDLSAPILTHRKQSWEIAVWRGKWAPNLEISLRLESRQVGISNKHTWAQFGFQKVPQMQLQSGATHTVLGTAHRDPKAKITLASRNFDPKFSPSRSTHLQHIFPGIKGKV